MEKVDCIECRVKILPTTAQKTGGKCMPCFKGKRKNSFANVPDSRRVDTHSFLDSLSFATGVPRNSLGLTEPLISESPTYLLPKGTFNKIKGEEAFQRLLKQSSDHANTLSFTPDYNKSHTKELLQAFALVDLICEVSSGGIYQYFCSAFNVADALIGFKRVANDDNFKLFTYAVGCAKRKRSLPIFDYRDTPQIKECKANKDFKDLDINGDFNELERFIENELPVMLGNDLHENKLRYQEGY
ncbi:hypothetical protein [Motilimonas sp. E26]|uniref:hypothetical protein n=1 Tax=Motilimonas sp. E26 TaxID=2865674 RepID=UPI001E62B04B|nr:hypothetical protein [Motilimonas sp. E26]MCE0555895.1 hypothetical protein [Motilimonas sp. E26]